MASMERTIDFATLDFDNLLETYRPKIGAKVDPILSLPEMGRDLASEIEIDTNQPDDKPLIVLDVCAGLGNLSLQVVKSLKVVTRRPIHIHMVENNPVYAQFLAVNMDAHSKQFSGQDKFILHQETFEDFVLSSVFRDMMFKNPVDVAVTWPANVKPKLTDKHVGTGFNGTEISKLLPYYVVYKLLEVADRVYTVFPQNLLPFKYSGQKRFTERKNRLWEDFERNKVAYDTPTGFDLSRYYKDLRALTNPKVEMYNIELVSFTKKD